MSVIFAPKNVFIPIQGHQHCGSEWGSQQSFLQLLTNDMIWSRQVRMLLINGSIMTDVCSECLFLTDVCSVLSL